MNPFKNHLNFSTIQVHVLWLGKVRKVRLNVWRLSGKLQVHLFKTKALLKTSSRWKVKMLRSTNVKWDPLSTANIKKRHLLFKGRKTRHSLTCCNYVPFQKRLALKTQRQRLASRSSGKCAAFLFCTNIVELGYAPLKQYHCHIDTEAVTSIWVTLIFACDLFFFFVRHVSFPSNSRRKLAATSFNIRTFMSN